MSLGQRAGKLFAAIALLAPLILTPSLSLALSGCRSGETAMNNLNSMLPEIKSGSNMSLPVDTQVLFEDKGREGDGYHFWALHSKEEFNLPAGEQATTPADTVMQTLERALPSRRIGKVTNLDAKTSQWENQRGQWRATKIMTETGAYLTLENFDGIK